MPALRRVALLLALVAASAAPLPVLAQTDTNSTPASSVAACGAAAPAHVRCFAQVKLQSPGGPVLHAVSAVASGGYGPSDLQSAYGIATGGGFGQTVAVVDVADDPNAEADLATYRSSYGLPACTTANGCFRKVNMGGNATPDAGWATEISLDLDMVSASCPNCGVLLVEVPQDSTGSASVQAILQGVSLAVQMGARQVSLSLGASEFGTETLSDAQLNRAGVSITVASGDSGYGTSYPATSPYVIAVGGTTLRRAANARGWTESVWAHGGSGCSSYEPKPSWQKDVTGCAKRTDNDIAVVGDPQSGVAVYDSYANGGWMVVGGTSAGAPLVAGIAADSGGVTGSGAQTLYSAPVNDVTSGSNGTCVPLYLCTGVTGYDGPTGVGTSTSGTVPLPPTPTSGYWLVAADGGIFPFGNAAGMGSTGNVHLNKPIVGMAATRDGGGYWLVASDGGIFPFGNAAGHGSTGNLRLNQPIVGMAATPDGGGYWLVASDGGIFPFGDAVGWGSHGGAPLNKPIVGMAATPDGGGYWLVAADGGIFPYGDAVGHGSTGGIHLNKPVVGMAPTRDGGGYWLVASDGGIFPFGDATGYGSTGSMRLNQPIVGMAPAPDGGGYWLVASDGGIFPFGSAAGWGSTGNLRLNQPIVGMAPTP